MSENILDVFAAELAAIESVDVGSRTPSLRRIATELVQDHGASFQDSSVAVAVEIHAPSEDELRVVAGAKRLERVLMNLLENAVRHSPSRGRVDVRLKGEANVVRVEVCDRGPGVDPELADRLFRRFTGGGKNGGSAGLGLFSCRLAIEKWGGSIGFDPRPGGGSIFWFELPRVEEDEPEEDAGS